MTCKFCQGTDIIDADSFIEALQGDKIELYKITSADIDYVEKLIPNSLKAAKGTFEIHQVIWSSKNKDKLYLRKRSCTHAEYWYPCSMCDLEEPVYEPVREPIPTSNPESESVAPKPKAIPTKPKAVPSKPKAVTSKPKSVAGKPRARMVKNTILAKSSTTAANKKDTDQTVCKKTPKSKNLLVKTKQI